MGASVWMGWDGDYSSSVFTYTCIAANYTVSVASTITGARISAMHYSLASATPSSNSQKVRKVALGYHTQW